MAEQTSASITIEAPPADVMSVIADFDSYPEWATGMKSATTLSTGPHGRAEQVRFVLDVPPIKDEYTLAYTWADLEVDWTLVEGKLLRMLDGSYVLRDLGGRTEVTYRLRLDVSIPLIGLVKRKGEKILIDAALRGLKTRVES